MIIGSHVHFNKEQIYGSIKEAISYGANALMLYTGAPQNTFRSELNLEYLEKAKKVMDENHIKMEHIICHAPYIINLANKQKIDAWNFSISFLKNEINRCESLGIKYIVLHPGSAVKHTKEEGIQNIIEGLNYIIKDDDKCMILLETMAGKGSECACNFEQVKQIIDGINYSDKVAICLDTCHIHDAGYKLDNFDEILTIFDKIIGLDKLQCIHVNDSKNVLGSHKDRHENIGYGNIGFENLIKIIYHEKLKDVPKILETPYVDRLYAPYKFEIEMILNKKFNPNLYEDIKEYYK